MNLKGILSISGKPGLYRMINNKSSGLIVEPLGGGVREFAATRQHQFTPVESIAIFTDDGDSVPIKAVLARMLEQIDDTPLPDVKASAEAYREYLLDVLPNHDRERVYVSDIKKLVRWYTQLDTSGALTEEDPEVGEQIGDALVEEHADSQAEGETAEASPTPKKKPVAEKKSGGKKPGERPGAGGALAGNQNKGGASKAGGKRKV